MTHWAHATYQPTGNACANEGQASCTSVLCYVPIAEGGGGVSWTSQHVARLHGQLTEPSCRGDLVSIETWFQKDSRISFERNWDIRDVKSGRRLGMATRCCRVIRA